VRCRRTQWEPDMTGFDAKTRYALLAMLDLARHGSPSAPVKVQQIAARTGAPARYLVHILLRLKRNALVSSRRGPRGGYWPLRSPEMVSVAQVLAAVEGPRQAAGSGGGRQAHERALARLWSDTERRRREFLAQVTIADLMRGGEDS